MQTMKHAIVRFRQVLLCGLVASLAVPATTGCRRSPETQAAGRLFGVSLQSMDNPVFGEIQAGLKAVIEARGDRFVALDAQFSSLKQKNDLTELLQEAALVHGDDAKVTRAIREMLGKAHYYATYLLKTNGAAEEEWRPFAERTRQIFRYLAEHQDPAALAQYERRVEAEFEKTMQRKTP